MSLEETPPPSAALRAALASMGPVRTRRPGLTLVLLLLSSLAWAGVGLLASRLRPDFHAMSPAWLASLASIWMVAFVAPFWWLVMPPRSAVLPAVHRAVVPMIVGGLLLAALLAAALFGWPMGVILPAERVVVGAAACFAIGSVVAVAPLVLAAFALRKVLPVGAGRAGAICGAAAGALGAVMLELHCPAGGLHPLVAHGACVLAGSALGATLFRLLGR